MKKRLLLTSFSYQQRPSRSKHSFMSIIGQSLSSVVHQNLIILHAGNAEQTLFYFSTASLPLKCELQTSQACPPQPPHVAFIHRVLSLFPLVQLFYLLLASWLSHFALPSFHSASILFHSRSLYLLLRCRPRVSDRFLTFQGRSSWQLRKVRRCVQ